RIKNPHHQLFAEGGGQRRNPQLYLAFVRAACLDATILRFTLFCDIHTRQHFEATGHGGGNVGWQLVNIMKEAIDAKTYAPHIAARLDMNVASALVVGVLQQPIDDFYDVLVIGIWICGSTQIDQLLKVSYRRRARAATGVADGSCERIKFDGMAFDI